jgi:NAD(P)-dependent dehydrogenase (short-subunit alcohol dehydrogenase family)
LKDVTILAYLDGASFDTPFKNIEDIEIAEQVLQPNFYGPLYCVQEFLPHLRERHGQIAATIYKGKQT